jgi:hypothetical protein
MRKQSTRGRTIEAPTWWLDAADARKAERGLLNRTIADLAAKATGAASIDESRISRCLTGDTTPIDLLEALSQVLAIPSPVYIAATIAEAREYASVKASHRRARELNDADRHTETLETETRILEEKAESDISSTHVRSNARAERVVGRGRREA